MFFFHRLSHTKVSFQVWVTCSCFITKPLFMVSCQHLAQPPSSRTTPCWTFVTSYSIYSQLPSILEAIPPSATWGHAMSWWQGPLIGVEFVNTKQTVKMSTLSLILLIPSFMWFITTWNNGSAMVSKTKILFPCISFILLCMGEHSVAHRLEAASENGSFSLW